jgi:putative ABC transport system permease protein
MLQDLGHALRVLVKSPGFTIIAVLTLAVGIGANTAIFSVVHGVLLRPLPYPEPERIVRVWEQTSSGARVSVSFPNFLDWREQATGFDSMAAYQGGREAVLGGTEPVFADVFRVTRGYFDVFGVVPAVGRTFTAEEQRLGGVPAAVISDAFWTQNLGGTSDLQTRRIQVRGLTCRVVGVMPAGFAYPEGADVWIPKELFADKSGRSGHNNSVVARLRTGVSLAQADAQLDTVVARLRERYPDTSDALSATSVRLHEALAGGSRDPLLMLVGAVGLVLLIACANVAGTLLARGEERRKELAIRAALGATRWRLARQLLTENVVLSLGGALGGLLLAAWLVRALLAINPVGLPRHDAVGINLPVVLFALALAILTPLLFGLVPSLQVSSIELRETLSEGGRAGTPTLRGYVRSALVAAQVAVALLLLVGASLLIRSFSNVMSVDLGFDTRGIITAEMSLPGSRYPDETQSSGFYRELLPKLRAIAGVRAAGAISAFPLSGSDSSGTFILEGDPDQRASGTQASYRVVTPGYFEAMGIRLLNGRLIGDEDAFGRDVVVAVNQDFVRRYIPSGDPIGRRFRYHGMDSLNEPWMTIVGVVGNIKHSSLVRETVPEAYVSYLQRRLRTRFTMTVAVRPAEPSMAAGLVPLLRERVRQADPDVPVEFSMLDERVGRSVAERRFTMLVLGLFAGIALLLAAVGIYGVLAYSVVQRTQEIGIRVALGADPRSVVRLMLRGAMGAVSIGVALGVAGALLATQALQSFLFGVRPLDPLAFIGAVGVLTAVALLAGYVPARRATRVDPLVALRAG